MGFPTSFTSVHLPCSKNICVNLQYGELLQAHVLVQDVRSAVLRRNRSRFAEASRIMSVSAVLHCYESYFCIGLKRFCKDGLAAN